jgi:hypothetical protein
VTSVDVATVATSLDTPNVSMGFTKNGVMGPAVVVVETCGAA